MSVIIETLKSYEFWILFLFCLPILYYIYNKITDPCKIPGPFNIPIIGYVPFMVSPAPHKMLTDLAHEYGEVLQFRCGVNRIVVLNSAEAIKEAYNKMELAGRPDVTGFRMWNENVEESIAFISENDQQQMFRRASLIATQKLIQTDSEKIITLVNNAVDFVLSELDNKKRSLHEIVKISMISVLGKLSFGKMYDPRGDEILKVYEMNNQFNELFPLNAIYDAFPFLKIFYRNKLEYLKSFLIPYKKFIKHELGGHEPLEEGEKPSDFQDIFEQMYKSKDKYGLLSSLERLRWVGSDLFFAGFSTTADHLIRALVVLARYPEAQEKIYSEIKSVMGTVDPDKAVNWESKQEMPYTLAFLEELLRQFTHTPFGLPRQIQADVEFRGNFIPKGTNVFQNTWMVNHDTSVYGEDAMSFRPERYLNPDGSFLERPNPKLDNMMVFGFGRRKCVGEVLARKELFCMICAIVQKARISLSPGGCGSPLEIEGSILLINKNVDLDVTYR